MKKTLSLLISAAILTAGALISRIEPAHAVADTTFDSAKPMRELATKTTAIKSSGPVVGMAIATGAPVSVVGDTTQQYSFVEVQNLDISSPIFCGGVNLSTKIANVSPTQLGWMIPKASGTVSNFLQVFSQHFDIPPGSDFFCQSAGIAVSTAVIRRGR